VSSFSSAHSFTGGRGGDILYTINIWLLLNGRQESKQAYPVLLAVTTLHMLHKPTLVEILPSSFLQIFLPLCLPLNIFNSNIRLTTLASLYVEQALPFVCITRKNANPLVLCIRILPHKILPRPP